MIIAVGALVGIVAIGHDNHSDYSDYSDYSEYGDSYLIQQVEAAKAKKDQAKRNLDEAEQTLRAEYQNGLNQLREKYGDFSTSSQNAQEFLRDKNQLLQHMKFQMEGEVREAQQKVDDINAAIQKINSMQLKK